MRRLPHTRPVRYGVALLLSVLALLLTYLICLIAGQLITALFFAAVLLTAYFGGLRPALLATVLSMVAIDFVLMLTPFT